MKDNTQNTEYEYLPIQEWEIEGCEDLIEDFFAANTLHDQQADPFYESSN